MQSFKELSTDSSLRKKKKPMLNFLSQRPHTGKRQLYYAFNTAQSQEKYSVYYDLVYAYV